MTNEQHAQHFGYPPDQLPFSDPICPWCHVRHHPRREHGTEQP